jgi:RNA polymerase sporulation-specific sigma factor
MSDEELVKHCKASEKAAYMLISRYAKTIYIKALTMFNDVVEADDLMQEGLLGLLNAIKTYDSESGVKFSSYSNVCITNKMKTALIKSNQNVISVDQVNENCLQTTDLSNPESIFIEKENSIELDDKISTLLSEKEWQVFRLFLRGSTYYQMARQLNISQKTVDNALQRVRRKLKSVWRADHF